MPATKSEKAMGMLSMGPKGKRALAELGAEVKERSAAGHSKFTVSLFCGCDGNFNGMTNMSVSRMRNAGQPFLLDLGVNVVDAEWDPYEYTMHYHIEVPERQDPEKRCPRCAEVIKEAAVVCRFCGHDFSQRSWQTDP